MLEKIAIKFLSPCELLQSTAPYNLKVSENMLSFDELHQELWEQRK